ncbi:MAG: energy transducer TonB [Aequorivita sp.]|nr:energy transducer TonB [Aequorivita sp.]MCB0455592.1 energy transducer TonB [Aequorivita sp.]HPE83246.1 energy transducer TonB [Aequorivita sp.]
MRELLFAIAVAIHAIGFSQTETEKDDDIIPIQMKDNIPIAVIESVPVYPGCERETGNKANKNCMSVKINEFIGKNFDMKIINTQGLPAKLYKISVNFKIDKTGKVVDITAKAEHPELEKEAIRVVSKLPRMKPGTQKGEPVGVLYSLPIVFKIEP